MPRTPLARHLQDAGAAVAAATARGVPVEQVLAEQSRTRLTRRTFLQGALAAGAGALGLRPLGAPARAALAPRIVVVGAGLAGLTCAYRLRQKGYLAEVYEGNTRVGGRCSTRRGAFDQGQTLERGGELIDQGHTAIRQLCRELGLTLDNLLRAEQNGTEPLYYFNGGPYKYAEATADIKAIWQKLHKDVSAAGYPTLYNRYTQRGWELDHMSITDWINETVPGGMGSRLGKLLDVAYNIEYGGECGEQSALNLLYLLGYSGQGQLRIFGPSNEKYRVRGGNDQIPQRLAAALAGQITTGARLVTIRRRSDGRYALTFEIGAESRDVLADRVVLALPFSVLRAGVEYKQAGFRPLKQTAIARLGAGTNSKLHVQFTDRHWQGRGCNGETYAETGYQCTWDESRAQGGTCGILINYTGGNAGAAFTSEAVTPATAWVPGFLAGIELVLPGITAKWNGRAAVDYPSGYPWFLGSYSYWKVGQYTGFAGVEREAEGNCHFAGEHTSVDFQGYLNGAVESGERAAAEVAAALKS